MFCAGRVPDEDLNRTMKACGGSIQSTVHDLNDDTLGKYNLCNITVFNTDLVYCQICIMQISIFLQIVKLKLIFRNLWNLWGEAGWWREIQLFLRMSQIPDLYNYPERWCWTVHGRNWEISTWCHHDRQVQSQNFLTYFLLCIFSCERFVWENW